jgi:recombination protein RecA
MSVIRRTIHRASLVEQVVSHAENDNPEPEVSRLFVPTGSALLNLALSDRHDGGYCTGTIANIIGDKSTGKTFLCLSTIAEMAHTERFNDYDIRFDDAEAANRFNMDKLFGAKTVARLKPPVDDDVEVKHSRTIQEFQIFSRRLLKAGKPLFYLLDSFDAISDDAEIAYADKMDEAHSSGKEIKGTYAMAKAKLASSTLRLINGDIAQTNSFMQIISQTRDNMEPMSMAPRTRSGGKALYFYCAYEMWLAIKNRITTTVNGKPRVIGVQTKIKISKNKATGKEREISLPIYYDYGVDDIGGCVDFLIEENHWAKNKSTGSISVGELRLEKATRAKIIATIEEKDWTKNLHELTQSVWLEIEEKLKLDRKPKYSNA